MTGYDLPALEIVSAVIAWTGTVVGCLMWLNRQFGLLKDQIDTRLPYATYEERHDLLAERVRQLELWRAAKNGTV